MTERDEYMMTEYVEREIITFRVILRIIKKEPDLFFKIDWMKSAFKKPVYRIVEANGARAKENTIFAWRCMCAAVASVMFVATALMSSWEPIVAMLVLFSVAFGCLSTSVGDGCGGLTDHQAGLVFIDTKKNLEWFYERIRRILPMHAAIEAANHYPPPTSHNYEPYVKWVKFLYNVKEL